MIFDRIFGNSTLSLDWRVGIFVGTLSCLPLGLTYLVTQDLGLTAVVYMMSLVGAIADVVISRSLKK